MIMDKPSKKTLSAVFILALALRFGFLFAAGDRTRVAEMHDAKDYQGIADSLLAGRGFVDSDGLPTEVRPPMYPLFLAGVNRVFGPGDLPVKSIQIILDSASVALIMLIAGALFGSGVALLAGLLMAVYPPLILYSVLKLGECLFTFLLCGLCYLLMKGLNEKREVYFYFAGAVQGAACLLRSMPALLPAFLFAYMIFSRPARSLLKGFLAYFLISASIMGVWTVRNYRVFDIFIPSTVGSGHLMWLSVQDDVWDGDRFVILSPSREYKDLENIPMRLWDKELSGRVLKGAAAHPLTYSKKLGKNFVRLWTLPVGKVMLEAYSKKLAEAYKAAHIAVMLLALYGIITSVKNIPPIMPVLLFLIYLSVMHTILVAVPRFRLPFEPFVLIFLAKGLIEAAKNIRSRFEGRLKD